MNADQTTQNSAGLRIQSLNFAYNGKPILSDIELAVPEGELFCLLGPSGCGKTTLLRLMGGLETPATGAVFLERQRCPPAPRLNAAWCSRTTRCFPG